MPIFPKDRFAVQQIIEKHPSAESWATAAKAEKLPEKWQESAWCQNAFEMIAEHGTPLARDVLFPKAHKLSDVFSYARFEKYGSNRTPDSYATPYPNGGGLFVSDSRARGFAPWFKSDARYYVRTRKKDDSFFCWGVLSGTQWLTVACLLPAVEKAALGRFIEPQDETNLSLEAVQHADGKILIILKHSHYLWTQYVAYLDAGQTLLDLMPDSDSIRWAEATRREKERAPVVRGDNTVDRELAARLGIEIRQDT